MGSATGLGMPERRSLLAWFEPRRTLYAWRRTADPYRILVSEIMLQQTQASRVEPAFERFVEVFPTVSHLAKAPVGSVIRAWAGLGYNRRAVRLAHAARAIVRHHAGRVPSDVTALRELPGVGPYTAAAVASLAFHQPVAAIDTNVRRVLARAALGKEPYRVTPRSGEALAASLVRDHDPAAWNQAVMDLGRELCRPRPRCETCPLRTTCRFHRRGAGAAPAPRPKGQPFEGSTRQLRGRIVRHLITASPVTVGSATASLAERPERVTEAVRALASEGLIRAGPAALAGRPTGRIGLA